MCSWKPVGNWAWMCRSCFIQETCRTCPLVQHSGTDIFLKVLSRQVECIPRRQVLTSAPEERVLSSVVQLTDKHNEEYVLNVWDEYVTRTHFYSRSCAEWGSQFESHCYFAFRKVWALPDKPCFEPVNGLFYRKSDWELIKHCKWDVTLFL